MKKGNVKFPKNQSAVVSYFNKGGEKKAVVTRDCITKKFFLYATFGDDVLKISTASLPYFEKEIAKLKEDKRWDL